LSKLRRPLNVIHGNDRFIKFNRARGNSTLRAVIDKIKFGKVDTRLAFWLDDPKNRRIIPNRFEKCGYVPVRNPARADKFWKIRGQRQVVYALSGLSLQEQLEAAAVLAWST
jgi:hypothetical protein